MDEMSKQSEVLEADEKVLIPELKEGKQQLFNCKNKLRTKLVSSNNYDYNKLNSSVH